MVNKVVLVTMLILTNFYLIYCFSDASSTTLTFFISSLRLSPLWFALFLFLSYEFYGQIRMTNLSEVLTSKMRSSILKSFFQVLLTIDLIFLFDIFAYDFIIYLREGISHPLYLIRTILTLFLYNVLPVILAIVVSMLLYSQKRIVGYALLVIVALVPTMVFERLARGLNIYNEYEFFKLFPYLKFMPNHSFGVPVLPYCWAKVCFLIFILTTLFVTKEFKGKRKMVGAVICFACAVTCALVYLQPVSKVDMHDSYQLSEMGYYRNIRESNENSDFEIEKYEMSFSIRNQLNANVKVYIKDVGKSRYDFTLYHGYIIKNVMDKNGKSINFEQEGDYVSVFPNNLNDNVFEFVYSGSNMTFYSNYQGTYLSGGFAYYPKAGRKKVYNYDYQNYNCILDDENTKYLIKIDQLFGKTYSNIHQTSDDGFEGEGNGVTLYSGMLDVYEDGNIKVVYPYLATDMLDDYFLRTETEKFKSRLDAKESFTIFSIPNMNNANYNPIFSNGFELVGLIDLSQRYDIALEQSKSEVE